MAEPGRPVRDGGYPAPTPGSRSSWASLWARSRLTSTDTSPKSERRDLRRHVGGPATKIRNINGIRKELVDEMRKTKRPWSAIPVVVLPIAMAGATASARGDKRPRRTNFWAEGRERGELLPVTSYDPNQFGTNEFVHFCKLMAASLISPLTCCVACLRKRLTSGSSIAIRHSGTTTLSDPRAASGYSEPFDVRYWGVGNESWGCGLQFPRLRSTRWNFAVVPPGCRSYGQELSFIASGT